MQKQSNNPLLADDHVLANVLLVSADDSVVQMANDAFNTRSIRRGIMPCNSLEEALDLISRFAYNVVFCDLNLPDGTALDLLYELNSETSPPLVILCSLAQTRDAIKVVEAGAVDYVLKSDEVLRDLPHLAKRAASHLQAQRQLEAAETELNELQQRFNALTGSSRDFIWEVDANAIYTFVSPQVLDLLGYNPAEVIGRSPFDLMPAEESDRLESKFRQIARLQRPISRWENTVRHKDGHLVMLETSGTPIIDDEGTFLGFRGVDRDISDRHRAEAIIRRRERILQAMAHASQQLLKPASSESDIQEVLALVGQAAEASRAYIYANATDHEGRAVMNHLYEWCADGIPRLGDDPQAITMTWEPLFHEWLDRLPDHQPVHGMTSSFSPAVSSHLSQAGTRSILVIPIFEGELWWGFVGIDDCWQERDWAPGEIDAIYTAARIIGAGLQRQAWEAKLHQLNEGFLSFGQDPLTNIDIITTLCGRLFGATFARYGRLEQEYISPYGIYNIAPDRCQSNYAEGQMCNDVIRHDQELYIPDVMATTYSDSDPAVYEFGICSYYGYPVRRRGRPIGSLCAVFTHQFYPAEDDLKLMAIMATAIGVEEDRLSGEAELRRLATAIEQAAEAICITDLKARIQYVNPAYLSTSGYSRADIIGYPMPFLSSGLQDEEFYRSIWRTLGKGEVWSNRILNRRADGQTYHEDAVISPIRDSSGMVVNYVAVCRDISKEIELEDQLRHSQKMESVGRLAGGVAHDFNNLLSVIMGYADMTLSNIPEDHTLYDMVLEIKKAGERATALTQQLLAFSRKQVLEVKSVNLNRILEDTRKMLERLVGEEVDLITTLDPGIYDIRADAAQIQQILMNLVVNARDAMPGNGRVYIETSMDEVTEDDPRITPDLQPGSYVILRVRDNGHGMDDETMKRIFDPFYTTKARGKGTGLGLATVHGIVKQHGGEILVESELSVGTVFSIFMPSETISRDIGNTTIIDQVECHGTETILLVEDDYNVLTMARRILEKYGYEVLAADGGQAAMRLVEQYGNDIHLVLTDVIMPRVNGPELYERLRANHPNLRVVYMSGYNEASLHSRGIVSEDDPILHKPFTIGSLTETVRMTLDE